MADRNAIARENIQADAVLAEMFSDIGITLDVGVVEFGGVVARRSVVDTAGERAETRNRIDGNDVLRTALGNTAPKHAVMVVFPTPPLPETTPIMYCLRTWRRIRSRSSR